MYELSSLHLALLSTTVSFAVCVYGQLHGFPGLPGLALMLSPTESLSTIAVKVVALNAALWSFWLVFVYPFCFSPLRHLPSPPGSSIFVGNAPSIFAKPPGADFLRWVETVPNRGMIRFRGWFNQDNLLLVDHDALKEVLQTHCYAFEKPAPLRKFLGRVQGDGLSVVEGDQHRFQRKAMNPAFHTRQIKELHPMFWRKSGNLVQQLRRELGGAPNKVFEVTEWASRASMDIIAIAALGNDFGTIEQPDHPVMKQFQAIFDVNMEAAMYFAASLILPQWLVEWSPFFKNARKVMGPGVQALRKSGYAMVQDKKTEAMDSQDILSVIIRTKAFPDENLIDQLVTFLAAGHETTSNTLMWATYLLAIHPSTQNALRNEIRTSIPSSSSDITSAQLEALPILNGVVSETLRLYPGAPLLLRECVATTVITGQVIPRGTQIVLCPWAVNRSTRLWGEDAGEFKPERWIDEVPAPSPDAQEEAGKGPSEEGEKQSPRPKTVRRPNNSGGASSNYAMLTFLQGPRRCIGESFSRAELRCLLAALVASFELEMADPNEVIVPDGIIGLKSRNGMRLRFTALEGW